MRQVTRKGLITVAAAGGVLALGGGYAQADSGAHGEASNSPGVLSGNSVQAPVHVPVNVCGNTVNVVGLLNPAIGNECANVSGSKHGGGGGSGAEGSASNSPGVGSGNQVQAPINVPVNACGNTVTVGGLLNPSLGNECTNDSGGTHPGKPHEPGTPEEPNKPEEPSKPQTPETPSEPNAPGPQSVTGGGDGELAATGMDALDVLAPAGVGLLLAGAVLYRRARAAA